MKKYLAALLLAALIPAYAGAAALQAFKPGSPTVVVSAALTSAFVALPGNGGSLLVFNTCSAAGQTVRIDITGAAATKPAVGVPGSLGVPPNTLAVLEIGSSTSSVAVLLDTGTACNVELTRGEGMAH